MNVVSDVDASGKSKRQKTSNEPREGRDITPSVTFGYTEMNKLEHCARSLQKCIRTIIAEGPDLNYLKQLLSSKDVDTFARQQAKTNSLLHLVASLKTLYNNKKLALFDQIVENKIIPDGLNTGIDVESLKDAIQVHVSKQDTPNEPDTASKTLATSGLPPLPKIKSASLNARVFQHKSTSANKTYLAEQEIVMSHNERIEFLGDSVLNTVVTYILYDRFPYANEGQLSQIRSSLVSNKTLAEFSVAYGFDKKLHCNIDEASLKTGKQKIYADLFEAYVGALSVERGYNLKDIQKWLQQLMAPKLSAASYEMRKSTPINKDAKTELYSLIGTASLHPVYQVVENGNGAQIPYKVHCTMDGVVLGEGIAPGLREAGLRAAMSALNNKEMLEKFGRKRLETDRSVSHVKQGGQGLIVEHGALSADFPLVADKSVLPNKFAKNELYAYFGKHLGLNPEYNVLYEEENNRYKIELKIKETVVSIAYDVSKKNAMSRAATVVLDNKHLLPQLVNLIN